MSASETEIIDILEQAKVIPMLKEYLRFNNFNLEVEDGGICAGLAAVFCKYALEEREEKFFAMLDLLHKKGLDIKNQKNQGDQSEDLSQLNSFIAEILLAFLPQKFNTKLSQDDNGKLVKILIENEKESKIKETKSMTLQYNLGLTASPSVWTQIFKKFKNIDGCAMTITSPTHSIAVFMKDGKFRVYDPSYNKREICNSEKELTNLFKYDIS
ncbi:hypothetical protein [Legionella tucsonensis]|uniref:Ankyrin repeat-containing protein n=1 Tax=Legionella tucsonensis TaxID=40335 RepID=A0A0W0ZTQ1_9GAMM|nr:hypothetical protein [Legionella tucsonensis]KTD72557.1 ankyrin repeat-containing protein [Legionella tucsonensis]